MNIDQQIEWNVSSSQYKYMKPVSQLQISKNSIKKTWYFSFLPKNWFSWYKYFLKILNKVHSDRSELDLSDAER